MSSRLLPDARIAFGSHLPAASCSRPSPAPCRGTFADKTSDKFGRSRRSRKTLPARKPSTVLHNSAIATSSRPPFMLLELSTTNTNRLPCDFVPKNIAEPVRPLARPTPSPPLPFPPPPRRRLPASKPRTASLPSATRPPTPTCSIPNSLGSDPNEPASPNNAGPTGVSKSTGVTSPTSGSETSSTGPSEIVSASCRRLGRPALIAPDQDSPRPSPQRLPLSQIKNGDSKPVFVMHDRRDRDRQHRGNDRAMHREARHHRRRRMAILAAPATTNSLSTSSLTRPLAGRPPNRCPRAQFRIPEALEPTFQSVATRADPHSAGTATHIG